MPPLTYRPGMHPLTRSGSLLICIVYLLYIAIYSYIIYIYCYLHCLVTVPQCWLLQHFPPAKVEQRYLQIFLGILEIVHAS